MDFLGHCGDIILSDIKTREEIFSTSNDRTDQEGEKLQNLLMASITTESRNTVNLNKSDFMNGNKCSGTCLLKVIVSKSQVDS